MELLFEIIFEIIIEGSLELGTSRKVPMALRVFLLLILGLVYGVLIGVFAMVAIECWKRGDIAAAIVVFSLGIGITFLVVYGIRKKYKENSRNKDAE